ncbi:MAG: alpha/beta hydrolase [Candidatus Sumerlaeaceae bacterium]
MRNRRTFFNAVLGCAVIAGQHCCEAGETPYLTQIAEKAESRYGRLNDLLSSGTRPVRSSSDWPDRRAEINATLLTYLGPFPRNRCDIQPRILREEQIDGYTRKKVRYLTEPGEDVTAFLLIPDGATSTSLRPAVLACHQTSEPAKEEVCGVTSSPASMQYGLDLVRRGYVVLAPDSITAGERVYDGYEPFETKGFDERNPQWSAIGKMAWDHMRGLDYLELQPYVDRDRIGVVGHSLGAYNAFFLAGLDERVKVVVESCGYCTIASDPGRERWARTKWFVHMPRLRPFVAPGSKLKSPFDFHEVLSLIAPRPLFQSVGLQDKIFGTADSAAQVHLQLQKLYGLLGAGDKLETYFFDGPHDFPPDAKERAYAFLDRWLKPDR